MEQIKKPECKYKKDRREDKPDRIKHKKGSGKAIIATARKMLSIIYDTLKNDWVFEDFDNFVLQN